MSSTMLEDDQGLESQRVSLNDSGMVPHIAIGILVTPLVWPRSRAESGARRLQEDRTETILSYHKKHPLKQSNVM